MTPAELLDGLKKDVEKNISSMSVLIGLSEIQLNWKSAPDKWSIAQCLHHLCIVDKYYLVRFRKILISGKKQFVNRDHYTSSLLGTYYIKNVDPKAAVQNSKTHDIYLPSNEKLDGSVLHEFIRLQNLLRDTLEKAKRYDLKKNKVNMPSNEMMNLRFADALIAIVRHDQRHMQQAIRVTSSEKFPTR